MKKFIKFSTLIAFCLISFNMWASTVDKQELNKKTVLGFYNTAINQKDFESAVQYLGTTYTQHNPVVVDGAEGLKTFIEFLRTNYPNAHSEIKKVFADGDYVILHVHSVREPGTRGRAIFDLFKLDQGKIIEHWDTIQDIPAESANTNGMF